MLETYDCIVIGAGPAGGTAAHHLARRGRSVLILEKARTPRTKPCGGGVSPQTARWLGFDPSPVVSARVTRFRCTWRLGEVVEGDLETREPLLMVRRDRFDQFIVAKAMEQGALLRDGTTWTALRPDGDNWILDLSEGPPVRARYLVAADGALGQAARHLGFPPLKHGLAGALEGEAAWPMADTATAHLDFGTVPKGYLWNFPKADGWSLGSGVFRGSGRVDLRGAADRYALAFGIGREELQVAAHPLHLWDGYQDLHTHRAVVAGEAACLVDPFTGVGILPAVLSGALAAEAIHAALAQGPQALAGYTRSVHREWGAEMVWARRLAQVFYRAPALAWRLVVKQEGAIRAMGRILCGEGSYASVARRVIPRLCG